ncbi:N-acetyltransferase [Halobacillus sp. BBL2006]|uniref:GNAT family N-acetyltransferase n=1 Tax=Halobacillus sp. BBL2006 TaxID=1543706 RepID=UPI000542BBA1|nr:N-acetyltransferase [Halobacillus sp. BBL2006]KHE72675.1 acyltransferase [Halobacillus sp. BBL2006]
MSGVDWKKTGNRNDFLDYLLLADEDETIVKSYIKDGDMFELLYSGKTIGVCLFTFPNEDTVEIKNIAIAEACRGLGIGKQVVQIAISHYQKKGLHHMIVGTANSSIENIAFYQKAGFRFHEIRKDFFLSYPQPIFENNIQALDMVVFHLPLKK